MTGKHHNFYIYGIHVYVLQCDVILLPSLLLKEGRKDPPPLPKDLITAIHPFTVTGVDFLGALCIKCKDGNQEHRVPWYCVADGRG